MSMTVLRGGMLAAILVLCRAGGAGAAKPPDLPLDLTGECRKPCVAAQGASFDTICAAFLNALTQERTDNAGDREWQCPACPGHDASDVSLENDTICDPHWLAQARNLYLIGVQCRQSGDLAMARSCFLEVQLLCPRSSFCRLARKQLQMMMLDQIQRAAARLHGDTGIRQAAFWTTPQEVEPTPLDEIWEQRFLDAARNIRRRQCQLDVEQTMVQQAERARRMYHRGERCRQAGELDQALQCFRAAHRLCPQCAFGQRAMKRVCDIEQQLMQTPDEGIGEEQETPPKSDEVRELEMLRSTVPLEIYLDEPSETPSADEKERKGGVDNYGYEIPPSSTAPPNAPWHEALKTFCSSLDVDFDTGYGLRAAITVGGNVWKIKYGPDCRLSIYVPPLRHEN